MRTSAPRWVVLLLFFASSGASASQFDVIINEVCYNPFTGDDRDEFVELYNRGPSAVDLSGWTFTEGISFAFANGASIEPGGYLVVSADAARAQARFGIQNVVGDFQGRLDNSGEILALSNQLYQLISRFHFEDGGVWPSNPDGLGPTLELVTPHEQNDLPQKWASSLLLEGTPGRRNSRFVPPLAARTLLAPDDLYRTFKGTSEPSNPISGWTGRTFNDGGWAEAQGPFGYGTRYADVVTTALADMQAGYTTFYVRGRFDLDASTLAALADGTLGLTVRVQYDDAFVLYVNGVEAGRANVGAAGFPVPRDAQADTGINSGTRTINLDAENFTLVGTGNVLALQGANNLPNSSNDFLLGAELILSPREVTAAEVKRTVVINEIRPTEAPGGNGFIELFNDTDAPVNIGGHWIIDSRGGSKQIAGGTTIAAKDFLLLDEAQLGFQPSLAGPSYALVGSDRATWIDGVDPHPAPAGITGLGFGRFRDGSEDQYLMAPTAGAMNALNIESGVLINEVLYHPAFVAPSAGCDRQCSDGDQWVELFNRGVQEIDVGGWSLSKGVEFTFAAGTKIPAGGYLIVAADRDRFLARYQAANPARVVGNWSRSLGRDSDTINLRDLLENRVDHVKYGDGGPTNDELPIDGVNDRTLASSEWPDGADTSAGNSLELIHRDLDNRAGRAWRAGPAGGTPAAANSQFDATPPPVVWEVENEPAVPAPAQAVRITCRTSSVSPIAKVDLLWHVEPAGSVTTVAMKDDGLADNGRAGDGIYGASIPGQSNNQIVGYQVRIEAQDGQSALVPLQPAVAPYAGFQGPYSLYQVSDLTPPANGSTTYRIVMAAADLNELRSRPETSNVLLPCTFIADGKAQHALGIRLRGETTRRGERKPYRVDLPPERRFRGVEHINFISTTIEHELLASDLFRRAGLPYMQEWTVNLVFQGVLDPLYVLKENIDGEFLARFYGGSDGGNLYRAEDPPPAGSGPQGDLTYYGTDPDDYISLYTKRTNKEENDYSDIIELSRAFDATATPNAQFPARMRELIDTEQWARFFAVQACLTNNDGGIQTGTGEDYLLYHVPAVSPRDDAGKWILIPWDIDETFTSSTERLFRPDIAAIRRFLTHPEFAPLYYAHLVDLRNGAFARFETRQRFVLIDDLFGFGTIDRIDSYITARIGFFDENVPVGLSAGATGSSGSRLIAQGETWKYFKGTGEPSGGNRDWARRTGFDDSAWFEGPSGFGYADGDDQTVLDDMEDGYTSLYIRRAFTVASPAAITELRLLIDYDDGFVAFLNGTEVTRREAPGPADSFVPFDEPATGTHEAGTPESIDISAYLNRLVAGTNVLAIQGLNTAGSTDFSLIPELMTGATSVAGGCGRVLYATGSTIGLAGRANAAYTRSVKVAGAPATYDSFNARWTGSASLDPGINTVRVEAFDEFGNSLEFIDLEIHRTAQPFTQVSGNQSGTVPWTAANSPYIMTANVVVPAGSRLNIGPGTVVLGQPGASIIVRGSLQAIGTREEPILLRAASCANRMGGIAFDGTGTGAAAVVHQLKFVDFEFGEEPAGFGGAIAPVDSKLLVEDCIFREMTANALDGINARVEVRRSLFERIHEGVHCNSSFVIVADCTFSHMIGDKDAIDFDLNGPGGERSLIEGNLIEYSSDDGIDLATTTVDIRNNVLRYIQDKALSLEENGPVGPPTVVGNLIHNSGTAIALKNGVTIAEGHHNTLVGNQEGINLFAKAGAANGGHGQFHSMIIWDNIFDVKLDARSTVGFTHSDIGILFPGAGNMASNPRFADELGADFSLVAGSPSIGSGKDGTDMGAIPFTDSGTRFIRGDTDENGSVDITDAIGTLEYLFRGGPGPSCIDRLDANDDGGADLTDAVFTLFFLFAQGSAPALPYPGLGPDPTPDALACP